MTKRETVDKLYHKYRELGYAHDDAQWLANQRWSEMHEQKVYRVVIGAGPDPITYDGVQETTEANAVVRAMLFAVGEGRITVQLASALLAAGNYSVSVQRLIR